MVRLLKDAKASSNSVVAVNASGSFPGFTLASLSACAALGIKAYVVASIGASTYGANMPGNTIADILLENDFWNLGYTMLAVTPGGSSDQGLELDPEELERVSELLRKQGVPFIRPADLEDAIALRESLFAHCTLLLNIGGNHASTGADTDLALLSGIIKPNNKTAFSGPSLVGNFLTMGKPVIQILNVRKLYSEYGLGIGENGEILGDIERLYRREQLPPLVIFLPVLGMIVLLAVFRFSWIFPR
jgi:poly-gamma-glutamate system protein